MLSLLHHDLKFEMHLKFSGSLWRNMSRGYGLSLKDGSGRCEEDDLEQDMSGSRETS